MKLRKLLTKDLFNGMKILKSVGVDKLTEKKNEIKIKAEGLAPEEKDALVRSIFSQFIIESLCEAQRDVLRLFADMEGKSIEQMENMPPEEFIGVIEAFLKENSIEELVGFFNRVQGLITSIH